jgi:anti-sigma B factor antagonist
MQARSLHDDGLLILSLEGDVDLAASPELREILRDLSKDKPALVVLDFQAVAYIDSSGLATLVEYLRYSQDFQGKLAIVGANERVRTVFELVRLHELLPLHASLAEVKAAAPSAAQQGA